MKKPELWINILVTFAASVAVGKLSGKSPAWLRYVVLLFTIIGGEISLNFLYRKITGSLDADQE